MKMKTLRFLILGLLATTAIFCRAQDGVISTNGGWYKAKNMIVCHEYRHLGPSLQTHPPFQKLFRLCPPLDCRNCGDNTALSFQSILSVVLKHPKRRLAMKQASVEIAL